MKEEVSNENGEHVEAQDKVSHLLLSRDEDFASETIFRENFFLTLSRRRPLSYRNQSIDVLRKSMDWFLYDNGLRLERVNRSKH